MEKDSGSDQRELTSVGSSHQMPQSGSTDASSRRPKTRLAEFALRLSFVAFISLISITASFHLRRLQDQVDILEQRLKDDRTQLEILIQKVGRHAHDGSVTPLENFN